ncbi:MAG TPA: adenylate/guanylate cyclase domain-containing protein [Actinomycetota bacterium]
MEPSEELHRVVTRFFEALRDGDTEAVSNRLSRLPGFQRFGTDPDEVWLEGETAARVWVQQMRDVGGGIPWRLIDDIRALSEGTVGWAAARTEVDAPAGGTVEYRFTCVLHLEHGDWKIVNWHSSIPVRNEDHGFLLTKSVDEIAEAVSESRPDLSASSAADGTVTIAFTDIEDSLRLNAFLGDRLWLDVLRAHNEVVERTTDEHGGTVVKNQGDGFMLAFASARRAVTCAQAIEAVVADTFRDPGSPIRVRIGLHVGETVHEGDDHFGHAVNYAARVASAAAGGEIVVSSLVYGLLAHTGAFEFGAAREVELKGIEGPQLVYPLASETAESLTAVD